MLQAFWLPFFPLIQNIISNDLKQYLPWRYNKCRMGRFYWRCSVILFILWMGYSTMESTCYVWMVECSNAILPTVHGQLTTLTIFTRTLSSSIISTSAIHRNQSAEKAIHSSVDWETISNTSIRWYLWLRGIRRRDGKQDNSWNIKWLKPQKVSSGIWNASP